MDLWLTLLIGFGAIATIFYATFYGIIYGAEYQRINSKRLNILIKLGDLGPNKTVYDLGAGFGRIMFKAAESKANVIGYEIDPVKVIWIRNQIKKKLYTTLESNIEIRQQNLLTADLTGADVVYCYLSQPLMKSISQLAEKQMKPGTKIISAEHRINNWKPTYIDNPNKIYVYTIGESNL